MPRTKLGEYLYDVGDFVEDYWWALLLVSLFVLVAAGVVKG